MTKKKQLICSICNQPVQPNANGWTGGHNAEPINDGRCCDQCNDRIVIPTRIVAIYRAENKR